jgi:hypothetical protein
MTYTVCWNAAPEQALIAHWTDASSEDRGRITSAVATIELALRERPLSVGFEHKPGLRTVIAHPVAIEFSVDDDDRKVTVLTILFE